MRKRFLSALLVVCMILAMVPIKAFAVENAELTDPKVTHLSVSYDGGEPIEILGAQPTISLPIGSKPVFTVAFDNNTLLNKVFVTSTKNGETKYLEAMRQGNQYVTDGYFDSDDTGYTPGTIAVTYSKKPVEVTESTQIGEINLEKMKQELETQGASVNGEIITGNDGSVSAQVVLGSYFSGIGETFVNASIKELTTFASIDSDEVRQWIDVYGTISSYALKGEDGKDYMLYFTDKDWTDANSYVMLVHDISGNKYIKMALKGTGLKEIAGKISQANKLAGAYLNYVSIGKEMDSLREDIEANPVMTSSQKAEANQKINDLENDKKLFMMGITFIPMFLGTAGVATPLMISALLAGYASVADYFWDYRVGMIQGSKPIEGIFSDSASGGGGGYALTNEKLGGFYSDDWVTGSTIHHSGSYYLAEDIRATSYITVGEGIRNPVDITVNLNGHTCHQFYVTENSTLHVYDSAYAKGSDGATMGGRVRFIVGKENSRIYIQNCYIGGDNKFGEIYSAATTTISSGTIYGPVNSTILNIKGGECLHVSNPVSGTLNVTGGTLGSMSNLGVARITGGIVSNGVQNGSIHFPRGILDIDGGEIYGGIVNTGKMNHDDTQLTISRGIIHGGVTDKYSTTTLHITPYSDIVVEGTSAFNETPTIKTDIDRTSSIRYHSAPNTQGIKMTIQEASYIDFTQPYVRLVADGASTGPSGGSVTLPEDVRNAAADGTTVFATSYNGGRLVECVRGTVKDGTAVFSRKIPVGWTLFFLNPVSLTPLCKPIVL